MLSLIIFMAFSIPNIEVIATVAFRAERVLRSGSRGRRHRSIITFIRVMYRHIIS
jgi:hypothetical protein